MVCVVFLYLQHIEYQNTYSTSKVRAFWLTTSKVCLRGVQAWFEGWVRIEFRLE